MGAMCGFFLYALAPLKSLRATLYSLPFLCLSLLALISTAWSEYPAETIKNGFLSLSVVIGAIGLSVHLGWEKLTKFYAIALSIFSVLSTFISVLMPSIGAMSEGYPGAWSGLWLEKQALGFHSAMQIIFVCMYVMYCKAPKSLILLTLFGFANIYFSESMTSFLMVGVALGVMTGIRLLQTPMAVMASVLWLGVVAILGVGALVISDPDLLFKLTGKESTFTGRTEIWEGIDYLISMKPILGWGYNSVWADMQSIASPYNWISQMAGFRPFNAHSSYRDVLLSLGIVGLVMLIIALAWGIINAVLRITSNKLGSNLTLSAYFAILLISGTESVYLGTMDMLWMFTVLLAVKISLPKGFVATLDEGENAISNNLQQQMHKSFSLRKILLEELPAKRNKKKLYKSKYKKDYFTYKF